MKKVTSYKIVRRREPATIEYSCDTCGKVFSKGEYKVTYISGTKEKHACIDRPCSPFSRPKGYESKWNSHTQEYEWVKVGGLSDAKDN